MELAQVGPASTRLTFVNDSAQLEITSQLVRVASIRSYIYDPFDPPI